MALLALWQSHYEAEYGKLAKVLSFSATLADRLLALRKAQVAARGRCGTKPGSLLKTHVPIRMDNWDITQPGYLEATPRDGGVLDASREAGGTRRQA